MSTLGVGNQTARWAAFTGQRMIKLTAARVTGRGKDVAPDLDLRLATLRASHIIRIGMSVIDG